MNWSFNYIAITNNVKCAQVLSECGIQQLMVDVEFYGKEERQKDKNTIINQHSISDVGLLKKAKLNAEILCRINGYYENTRREIEDVINEGADCIMIPMIINMDHFNEIVIQIDGRCKILPLIETPYSMFKLNEILNCKHVNQVHFGLNDLFLSLGMKNLFEVLLSPLFMSAVKYSTDKASLVGFGGIGDPNTLQKVDPIMILNEHLKLGSRSVILSRSFFNESYNPTNIIKSLLVFEDAINGGYINNKEGLLRSQVESM